MAVPKLIIRPKKYTEESAVISMRLPKDMICDIDAIAKYVGCTRNEIMVKCFEFGTTGRERPSAGINEKEKEKCLLSNAKCVVEI